MDFVEAEYNEETMEDASAEQIFSIASSCISGIYGDPQVLPRVGDQYQVEIPPLTVQLDSQNPTDTNGSEDADCMLPIPVVWVQDVVDHIKYEWIEFQGVPAASDKTGYVEYKPINESQMNSGSNLPRQYSASSSNDHSMPKSGLLDGDSDNGKGLGGTACCDHTVVGDQMNVDVPLQQCRESNIENKDYHLVPSALGGSWSNIEQESFLLGLYIFGKNLVQVKRFVESKGMGDVQSFYYGQFFRSSGHHKWSECRKMRTRRSIHGQRIFTGWRQQELLSRLLPRVSDDCGNALVEVTKIFGEGKISLEDYVSSLKGMVGLEVLVEAIGVGKGRKNDLTGMIMEPMRTNQSISLRSEIPIGKACSTLTSGDIIKFLTGDFRLSKARSNDLFWEAVWPRLLARGWHSEQPKNHGLVGTKHPLVFLIPGIKKFSRRKLVKGDHYFDSISDVLNKVASDPKLLELKVEAANNGTGAKEEYEWDQNVKFDRMGPPDHQRRCYLRPRLPNCNSEVAKFTIVDTSLHNGEEGFQVRELRSLPVDSTRNLPMHNTEAPAPSSSSSESDSENSFRDQINEHGSSDMLLNDKESCPTMVDSNTMSNGLHVDISSASTTIPQKKRMSINESDSAGMSTNDHKDQFPSAWNVVHFGVRVKRRFGSRTRSNRRNCFRGHLKLPKLVIYNLAERSHCSKDSSACLQLKEEEPCCRPYSLGPSNITVTEVGQGRSSQDESNRFISGESCFGANTVCAAALSHDNQLPRTLIDLNLPHVSPDFETVEPFTRETTDGRDGSIVNGSLFVNEMIHQPEHSHAVGTSNGMAGADLPVDNARRQSTRNRPLTTRVLEAFECGFFSTRRRARGTKLLPHGKSMRRSSRQYARDVVALSGNVGTDNSRAEGVDEECSSNTNMDTESQIWSAREGTQDLVRVPETAYQPEISTGKNDGCC